MTKNKILTPNETKIVTGDNGETASTNYPFPTNGDSVYCKDIDIINSDIGDFSGEICDFFTSLKTVSTNVTSNNPKTLIFRFKRSIQTSSIGFGCDDPTKGFSNVVIKILGSADEIRQTIDNSTDNTIRRSFVPKFIPDTANGIIIEFHTENEINLSNIIIYKSQNRNSRIQALNEITNQIENITSRDGAINVSPEYKNDVDANYYLYRLDAEPTLTSDTLLDDTVLNVDSTTNVSIGDAITLYEDINMFQSLVVATTANTITLASPIDGVYTTSAEVEVGPWNMAVDGSITPQTFYIKSPPNARFHIHTVDGTILDQSAMDDALFGGIPALTNGILFRQVNGTTKQLALIVNNVGFFEFGFENEYADKAPSGYYGFRFRKKVPEINGIIIDITYTDRAQKQLIIRDNLTDLDQFTNIVHGHIIPY